MNSKQVRAALREAGVGVAYLFGSRARADARPDSDVDIGLLLDEPLGLMGELRLATRISEALQVADVDVVDLSRAPLGLRGRVVQEGRLLLDDDPNRRVAFEVRTRMQYFDEHPTLQRLARAHIAHVAERGLNG